MPLTLAVKAETNLESEGNKMIKVEGFKAFRGTMRIKPKGNKLKPFELNGEFLFNPSSCCWYGCGSSFCEEICEIVLDEDSKEEVL